MTSMADGGEFGSMNVSNLSDVTLKAEDAARLAALTTSLGAPRGHVIARGLEALAREEEALDALLREGEESVQRDGVIAHEHFVANLHARFPDLAPPDLNPH